MSCNKATVSRGKQSCLLRINALQQRKRAGNTAAAHNLSCPQSSFPGFWSQPKHVGGTKITCPPPPGWAMDQWWWWGLGGPTQFHTQGAAQVKLSAGQSCTTSSQFQALVVGLLIQNKFFPQHLFFHSRDSSKGHAPYSGNLLPPFLSSWKC